MTSEEVKVNLTVEEIITEVEMKYLSNHSTANINKNRYFRRLVRRSLIRAGFSKKDIPDSYKLLFDLPVEKKKKAGRAK